LEHWERKISVCKTSTRQPANEKKKRKKSDDRDNTKQEVGVDTKTNNGAQQISEARTGQSGAVPPNTDYRRGYGMINESELATLEIDRTY
jgi:hypothetical protein